MITAHSRSATCLNCGAPAPGEYCGNCGQRNHQLRASLWHLASEIASEAFEFDSRIRRTLFPFFFKFVNVLPKLMFVLLPLLAFVLKVLYFGGGRFYVEHVIFTMHVQAFAFLVAIPAVATHSQILGRRPEFGIRAGGDAKGVRPVMGEDDPQILSSSSVVQCPRGDWGVRRRIDRLPVHMNVQTRGTRIAFSIIKSAWFTLAVLLMHCEARADQPLSEQELERVDPLEDATRMINGLIVDLRYATTDNFLKRKLYPDGARCLLRRSAARKLARAAEQMRFKGLRLKVYDCYRPVSVQWEMWKVMPKPGYVADPRKGSNHNRGVAVDLTLASADGTELEMPTPFDTFTPAAHHDYAKGSAKSRENRETLRQAMEAAGFQKNAMEWWHYELPDASKFPVLDRPVTGR